MFAVVADGTPAALLSEDKFGVLLAPPNARVIASANPPMHNAQKIFSNGANGSWIPSRIDEAFKIIFFFNFSFL